MKKVVMSKREIISWLWQAYYGHYRHCYSGLVTGHCLMLKVLKILLKMSFNSSHSTWQSLHTEPDHQADVQKQQFSWWGPLGVLQLSRVLYSPFMKPLWLRVKLKSCFYLASFGSKLSYAPSVQSRKLEQIWFIAAN